VFGINDGSNTTTALFKPQTYGEKFEDATYKVDGIYTFADSGNKVNSNLIFQNGNLVQVFGVTGNNDTGAPREITPQKGDTFTLLDKWYDQSSSGGITETYLEGKTLTFGSEPFKWQQLYAAAGDYMVGFIIEDLDGNQHPVYTQVTVQ
jgi:hypothetical protein